MLGWTLKYSKYYNLEKSLSPDWLRISFDSPRPPETEHKEKIENMFSYNEQFRKN